MHGTTLFRACRLPLRKTKRSGWICRPCLLHTESTTRIQTPSYEVIDRIAATPPRKPFYVSTPIFYVNAAPHVGHLYAMVVADVIKRWQEINGRACLLSTGTDEHGMKVQQAAAKAKSLPAPFCDKGAEVFKKLATKGQISYDRFIRTTDPDHQEAVRSAWYILQSKDLIYTRKHEGWYSVSDETFYPTSAVHLVLDPPTGRKMMASIETGKEVEWTSEINYHFRLSAFRDELLQFYRDEPNWIQPATRMNEVVSWVENGLEDLSISRPTERLRWGIRVPHDQTQTIYVWIDALINYITFAGYPWPPSQRNPRGWPADVHVVGKDILRFHCIYWPALLKALDLPVPTRIIAHAHWTLGKQKMSKSTGVVVNPFFAIERFGIDTMRFFLMFDGKLEEDSEYGNHLIIERYNKTLRNALGNLATRVLRARKWNIREAVVAAHESPRFPNESTHPDDVAQYTMLSHVEREITKEMRTYRLRQVLHTIMKMIYQTNAYVHTAAPWALEQPRRNTVIYLAAEALRIAGICLQPYMPGKASQLLEMLGVEENRRSFQYAQILTDDSYGTSRIDLSQKYEGLLFPPIVSD